MWRKENFVVDQDKKRNSKQFLSLEKHLFWSELCRGGLRTLKTNCVADFKAGKVFAFG